MTTSFPVLEAVKARGAGASHEGPRLRRNEDAFGIWTDDAAALAIVAGTMRGDVGRRTPADVTVETCQRIFQGRAASVLDDLAETWWRAEHGADPDAPKGSRPRPYSALPLADRAQLREHVSLVLSRRTAESMGDAAVLEAELRVLVELPARSLARANAELVRQGSKGSRPGSFAASAACAIFAAGRASIAHAGTCRVYRVRGARAEALTREHDLVNEYDRLPEAMRRGMTRAEVAALHGDTVVRALGLDASVEVDRCVVPAEPGDVFVLATDGFWKALPAEAIGEAVHRHGLAAAERMIERARIDRPDHPGDNLTVVVIEVL